MTGTTSTTPRDCTDFVKRTLSYIAAKQEGIATCHYTIGRQCWMCISYLGIRVDENRI